ncbi:hypothetical protein F5884DRAFT_864819 [Xylogone sp. PMI_703]|nr:hypothetical protein F5884DRAFT_864819 [Xylogone sp. PMI_703]
MDNPASLKPTLAGAYAVFSVTNYCEKMDANLEIAQGKATADAAVEAGAFLLIWSTLANVSELTNGELTGVEHCDSKASVEAYIRGLPINAVFYEPVYYMQNFLNPMLKPKVNNDGTVTLSSPWPPNTRLPMIDITDSGMFVAPALLDPVKYNGKTFTSAAAYYTAQDIVDTWSRVSGKEAQLPTSHPAEFRDVVGPFKTIYDQSFVLVTKYSLLGAKGPEAIDWMTAQLEVKPTTWEEYLQKNGPWFQDS